MPDEMTWLPIMHTFMCRIVEEGHEPDDERYAKSILWWMAQKVAPPESLRAGWKILPSLTGEVVEDAEMRRAMEQALLLPREVRELMAKGLGRFAKGNEDAPADSPRRVYAREVRRFLTGGRSRQMGMHGVRFLREGH